MKSAIPYSILLICVFSLISVSCGNQDQSSEEPAMIENTLKSVSYFKDTVGIDPQQIMNFFTQYNEAIAEIGFPDAGYQLWLIQEDTSDISFILEGHWPNQNIYNEIHEHPLYQQVAENNQDSFDGVVRLEYHRFTRIK